MDDDLWPIAIVLWLASLARVVLAILHGGDFGAEPTLALGCVLLIPAAALPTRKRFARPRQPSGALIISLPAPHAGRSRDGGVDAP